MAINDFGEKIGGAKKDLWKSRGMILEDLSEMNAAEKLKLIKKDNVWQKPDYAEMVANGLPIKVAYFIKTVRDSLGAKPVLTHVDKTPEKILDKQEKYIKFVGAVRDAVMNCKTEEDVLALGNRKWLINNGFIEDGNSYYITPTAAAGGVITNKFLRAFCISAYNLNCYDREIARKQFLYSDEQKILSKYEFLQYINATWKKEYNVKDVIELEINAGRYYIYPKNEFANESSWEYGTYFIMSKSPRSIVARNFKTLENAKNFIIEKEAALKEAESQAPKKIGKTRFVPAQLEHIQRSGDEVRYGRSITGQDYLKAFGFKGGEFGNWMSEKDRQASLNFGYEAFYDLAKALKIDLKDISLGNSLSIAFGARGSGNALAHYEPLREVINLTKMRGAGSLAHEWGHALDDIIGKRLGFSEFMTSNQHNSNTPKSLAYLIHNMKYKDVFVFGKPKRVYTDFYNNSLKFDKLHSKSDHGYWQSTEEMFARAFACYVYDKIEGRSDYLCGHANLAATNIENSSTGNYETIRAYPEGDERKTINKCFDKLFVELKEIGLLQHKEDFSVDLQRSRSEPEWRRFSNNEEEAYPLSLFDMLDDAYERSGNTGTGEQLSFDFDKLI